MLLERNDRLQLRHVISIRAEGESLLEMHVIAALSARPCYASLAALSDYQDMLPYFLSCQYHQPSAISVEPPTIRAKNVANQRGSHFPLC